MSDKVRGQFEAWTIMAGGHPSVLRRNAQGDYALGSVRAEYAVWQASRAAALEEAEEAVDAVEPVRYTEDDGSRRVDGTDTIAACVLAIRALAGRGA